MSAPAVAIEVHALELAGEEVQTVDGRTLHAFLQVRRDFTNWIRARIEQYGFVEDRDFVCSPVPASKGRGGSNRRGYHLTLDMAKELAMVERTERGKQARTYFIECERQVRTALAASSERDLADPEILRRLLLEYTNRALELEQRAEQQAGQVAALERIGEAQGAISITKAAKLLQLPPSALFSWMKTHGWLYRHPEGRSWLAYQPRIDRGQLRHKAITIEREDGTPKLVEQVLVTPKGLARLAELLELGSHHDTEANTEKGDRHG